MRNQKRQEIQTHSIAFEQSGQLADPHRRHKGRMDSSLLHQEVEFANQALGDVAPPGTLLDLFCGIGEVSPMLQAPGLRTLGLDLNPLALAAFQQHSQDTPLVRGDALHMPLWDGSVDVIVAIHGFDLVDRAGLLQECSRVLRSGGLLIFDALNRHSYKLSLKKLGRFFGLLRAGSQNDKWIDVFSFREVLQLISLAGFEFQSVHGYGWPPFSVRSNTWLVTAAVSVERALRLERFPRVSPRIIVAVRKKAGC